MAGFLGASSHRYIQYTVLPYLQALVIDMPFSRTLETEADKLGMELMALAGYDPQEAVEVWKRMEDGAQGGSGKNSQVGLPEFLSTHPSHQNRINRLQAQVPAARALQQQALRLKKEKGERIPDGTQSILLPSRVRQKVISPKDALLQGRRREASAQTAMRASNLVGAALERESRA
uniref:Zn-dependent protease with chaperone function n=1 Tax=Nannochloropsis gaditana (strain CCMP526) TaxID=1093141 RepID=I2CRE1_NANGC